MQEALKHRTDRSPATQADGSVIVIQGPTASGKTAVACALADLMPVDLISADSRQIYRHMNIGTAKPDADELTRYPHACIDIRNPDEEYSAGMFASDALTSIKMALEKGRTPVIVGGSGLYIRAACHGLFDESDADAQDLKAVREELTATLNSEGIDKLYAELQSCDPAAAEKYADRNPRRILRALEFYRINGKPLSAAHKTDARAPDFHCEFYQIDLERDELYQRINERAKTMFATGLVEECEALLAMGYDPAANALNTVGYKEVFALLRGEIDREEALELTARKTRNYAKRQLTWFRHAWPHTMLGGTVQEIANSIAYDYIRRSSSPNAGDS